MGDPVDWDVTHGGYTAPVLVEGHMGKNRERIVNEQNNFAGPTTDVDALFDKVASAVEVRRGKKGDLVGTKGDELQVLPVPSLAMRYVLQSVGWLLSRVTQIVGPPGSYKSTFATEVVRWHLLCNGRGAVLEAETKPTPELRAAGLHYQTNGIRVETCQSLESWQRAAWFYTETMKKQCSLKGGPGPTIPLAIVVDSISGKACESTIAKVQTEGSGYRDYAVEANINKMWFQTYSGLSLGWPFSLIGVNHVKKSMSSNPMSGSDRSVPGGEAVKYQQATDLQLDIVQSIRDYATYSQAIVRLRTFKNTYGRSGLQANIPLTFWYVRDENDVPRLYLKWEWWIATTRLLCGDGMSATTKAKLLPKIEEAIDIHEKSGGAAGKLYWSKRLGIASSDAVSANDFGMIIETRPDVLHDLYCAMGIAYRPMFTPGVSYMSQFQGFEHVVEQARWAEYATTGRNLADLRGAPVAVAAVTEEEEEE